MGHRSKWLEPPFFIQMVFGVLGGAGAELDNLVHMNRVAERLFGGSYEWSVLAAGRNQMRFATTAAMLGGNLRVGLEDSLYAGPGRLAESNAQQVRQIRGIVEGLGMQIAAPDEARSRLALKAGTWWDSDDLTTGRFRMRPMFRCTHDRPGSQQPWRCERTGPVEPAGGSRMKDMGHVAVLGTGVIGASWAALFLAAGKRVTAHDPADGRPGS